MSRYIVQAFVDGKPTAVFQSARGAAKEYHPLLTGVTYNTFYVTMCYSFWKKEARECRGKDGHVYRFECLNLSELIASGFIEP